MESIGNTQLSLQKLRNSLARSIDNPIKVLEISTCDQLTSFLVIDGATSTAAWTGNGFRQDLLGEGGAGLNSAKILFLLFNIKVSVIFDILDLSAAEEISFDAPDEEKNIVLETILRDFLTKNARAIRNANVIKIAEQMPSYIRI
jgi:hypothetical protein